MDPDPGRGGERLQVPGEATEAGGALPGADPRALARVRRLATLLDAAVGIPGTRLRFGLDSLLGLIPGGGDVAGALLSGGVVLAAARLGATPSLLLRMLGNVALDALLGTVPVAGDLFDVAWKANMRNVRLLERHLDDPEGARRGSRALVVAAGAGVAVVILLVLAAVVGAARVVASLLGA